MSNLTKLISDAKHAIKKATNITELNHIRVEFLGKKGYLTLEMMTLCQLSKINRPKVGKIINEAKEQVQEALELRKIELENEELNVRLSSETIDVSLPGRRIENGTIHPVTNTINFIENFFCKIGFSIVKGLEIEDSYHNFDALNIPIHHPARSNSDTFWFDENRLLRTHTSCIQIRAMKNQKLPVRIISSGKVYRNDCDKTHTPMFHQVEGLIIEKNISFSNLKGTLYNFLKSFFTKNSKINFRPSYFPFTEPSAEVDIMNKKGKWIEVLGCGMVHQNILHKIGINPEFYSGFAFGMGIERLIMLRHGIKDIRAFFQNDLRFLKQFK